MKVHLTSRHYDITSELDKYAHQKVAKLNKLIPRKQRAGAVCELEFSQTRGAEAKKFNTCGVRIAFDDTEVTARETTQHMYAALDVAAVHIEQELKACAAQKRRILRLRLKRRGQVK